MTFDGPAVDMGRMEVNELSASLLALADLTQAANALLYPTYPPVSLELTGVQRGSFLVELLLRQRELGSDILDLFSREAMSGLANLLEVLFAGQAGVLWLYRESRKRRARRAGTSDTPGHVLMELNDGRRVSVSENVATAYDDALIRHTSRRLVLPLNSEGVEALTVTTEETEIRLRKSDAEGFAADPPESDAEPTTEQVRAGALMIAAVAMERDRKWWFRSGRQSFSADVEDEEFLRRMYDLGEVRFGPGDVLICDFELHHSPGTRTTGTIQRVIDHRPPTQTRTLFDGPDDGSEAAAS